MPLQKKTELAINVIKLIARKEKENHFKAHKCKRTIGCIL